MVGVRRPRVVVVGAGLAGLRCGEVLHSSGHFDVVVLEGASRIGGRAWTVGRLDGAEGLMEAGATYIHGAEGNPLVRISAQHLNPLWPLVVTELTRILQVPSPHHRCTIAGC